jgi:hypothetical protein
MLAWVHTLAWPVAAVWISANARRAVAAVALAIWPKPAETEEGE